MVTALKGMQISNIPGGVFLIDRKKKQAVEIITKTILDFSLKKFN